MESLLDSKLFFLKKIAWERRCDYDQYILGDKGNQLLNEKGLNGTKLSEGEYIVSNDKSGSFGQNTPILSNAGVPGEVNLPEE